MRNRLVLRVIVVVAGVIGLLLGVAIALLQTSTAKRLAFEQVRKILAKQGVILEAVDFDYSLLTFRISTGRASIRSASAPNLPSLFAADHFTAGIALSDLIHSRYRVEDSVITNPKIQIVIDEQGRDNIPSSSSTTTTGQAVDWLILKMRSTGGSLAFEDRSQNALVRLPLWDLAVDGSRLTGEQEIQFKTRQAGEVRYNGKIVTVENIDVQAALKQRNEALDVRRAQLSSSVVDVEIRGTVENLNDPRLDLAIISNIHLKPASQYLSVAQKIEGDLHVDASVKGRPKELKAAGHLKGENLTAELIGQIALDADVVYDFAGQRARLNSFQTRSPDLSVSGAADVALALNAGESSVDVRLDVAELANISKMLKLPVTVASRATGNGHLRWPGLDFTRLGGDGRFQLSALPAATNVRRVPLAGVINVNADGGNTVASIDSLDAGALHLRGQLTLQSSKQISGAFRVETSNTGQALKQLAAWSGNSLPAGLALFGPAGIDANLGGTLERPRIGASFQANGLQLNELKNLNLEAVAEYTPEQIDVQRVALKWEEESLTGSGRIGLTARSPTLDARAEMPNAPIHRILAALGKAEVPADGNIHIAATVSGTIQNPAANLLVSASDLQAYSEPFGTLSAEARIENQVVELRSLSLNKAEGGQLQASGRYETTSGRYAIQADSRELRLNRVVLPQGTTVSANLMLNTESSGTFENPIGVFELSVRNLQVDEESVGSIDLNASVADHLARIMANAPSYGLTANASVGTERPYPANVEIRGTDTDISSFPVEKLKEISGRLSATVNASADLSDINNGRVRAEVPSLKLAWRDRSITSDGPIGLEYANRELTISQAAIRLDDSTLRLSGNLPLDAGSTGELKVEGRTNLAALTDLIHSEAPVKAQGQLVLDGSLRGNLKRMDPEATITLTGGSIETSALAAPLLGLNLKATAKDGRLLLEQFTGEWASARISAKGEAPFALLPDLPIEIPRPAAPARLSAEIAQFKLSALPRPPQNADGTISLKIEAEASRPDINVLQAQVTFPDLRLNAGAYSLEQVGTSTIEVRNGVASIQQFELKGPQTNVHLAGSADLRDSGPIDVRLEGNTDAAVLALFNDAVRVTGDTRVSVAATGTVRQPVLNGFVEMQNGQAQIEDPRIAAENVQLRLNLNGSQVHVARLEGSLNGGSIKGEGNLNLIGAQPETAGVTVTGDGIYFEFPAGVRTVSNARLSLKGDFPRMTLSGNIDVIEGTYTDPLTIDRGLLRYLESQQSTITVTDQPSEFGRTQLDVGLQTLSPLVVNNNIAHGNINAELRLLGTVEQPGLTGRIDVEEGAELNLRERKYSVDRGVITFTNERAIEPILDIEATTKVSSDRITYDITMRISGDATRKIETVLTSDPALDEADIVSLLATGRTLEKAGNAGAQVAKEQVLSYVAGELGTSITEEAGRALGLSQVRIEPSLIAAEAEPTARLTIGKDITPQLDFVYSMNLRNSNDQIWIADYNITRRFSARGLRQSDDSYRFQFQHDVLFGLRGVPSKPTTSNVRRKIGSIQFSGSTHLTEKQLSSAAGLKAGKTYDFLSVQNGRNRLERTFAKEGRLESRISVDRSFAESAVDLTFRIKEGPQVELDFEGWDMPDDLKDQIRDVWSQGVIDAQRVADVVDLIENRLVRDRYFGSHIDSSVETPDADSKRVVFRIQPGVRYDDVRVEFEGVRAVEADELQTLLKGSGFFDRDLKKRKQAVPLIENLYRERGYIDVKVDPPRNELNEESKTVRIVFRVTEGPLYRFGQISFDGNREFIDADLIKRLSIGPEAPFGFKTVQRGQQTLQDLYRKIGYNDVAIQYSQVKDVPKQIVDVTFNIEENYQRILKEVEAEGNQKTSKSLIRSQIALEPGAIVSYDKLSQARSNLYNTGAYSFVDIAVMPLDDRSGLKPNQTAVRLIARVRELQPWQVRYGGFYDTERGPGGVVDFSNRNMLGSARVVGVQTRYDSDLHEVRTYFSQPTLHRFPLKSIFSAFQRREIQTDFITDRTGFSPTLEYRFHSSNVLTFGYRFEKVHTFDKIPDPIVPFNIRSRVAPLTSSFTRDVRDDPLDASHGRFTSHAFEWGLEKLGSELQYIKYFGQYFAYLPFGKPTTVPWVHTTRNRLVVALGARLGLAKGLGGQDVIRSERFRAGGGTTVRGFEQDHLGPLDSFTGEPLGGDAMVVLNSELRFPLYKFFDGVAFVDAGNVYPHLSDFKPFDLRASSGVGLRIRTPYLVLRVDYGFKLAPRAGEPRSKLFFSLGQAF